MKLVPTKYEMRQMLVWPKCEMGLDETHFLQKQNGKRTKFGSRKTESAEYRFRKVTKTGLARTRNRPNFGFGKKWNRFRRNTKFCKCEKTNNSGNEQIWEQKSTGSQNRKMLKICNLNIAKSAGRKIKW